MNLLVTRPEPDAQRTAEALRACGHNVLIAPMLRMEPVPYELPDRSYAAVVLTSANAARSLETCPGREQLTSLPAFTVGRHTARAARAAGFVEVHSADGDKNDLASALTARFGGSHTSVVYLAGEDRAGDLALGPSGVTVVTVVVYRMRKTDRFLPPLQTSLMNGQIEGVLHFSRRSAEAYIACARLIGAIERALAPWHYCLSRQVAAPLAAQGASRIKVALRPHEDALIDLVSS